MHFLTSTLLAGVLLTVSVMTPSTIAQPASFSLSVWQPAPAIHAAPVHLVKKGGQPKHRGSGRCELANHIEPWVG